MSEPVATRRTLLKAVLGAGGTFALGVYLPGCATRQHRMEMADIAERTGEFVPNAWIRVTPANEVVLFLDRVEMGQGTMTSHAMLVGEELEVDPASIRVELAVADRAYDNPGLQFQVTGGSLSVKESWVPLRKAAATAREMLKGAAASLWAVDVKDCDAEAGAIVHRYSKKRIAYGALTRTAALMPLVDAPLKPPSAFRVIGKPIRRVDAAMKSNGTAKYGIDVQLPGMLTAVVVRPPSVTGRLKSFRGEAAERSPGVRAVFAVPTGVAVVADTYWQAKTAADRVEATWDDGLLTRTTNESIREGYRRRATERGKVARNEGDALAALARAHGVVEAVYEVPYLAHATMEPQNATAHVHDGRCEIWAPTQAPGLARLLAAEHLGFALEQVKLHQTLIGGGFGRRLAQDYVVEAVGIAARVARPVKVVWSREEDLAHDVYRPRTYNVLKGAVMPDGRVAWFHRAVGPSIESYVTGDWVRAMAPDWLGRSFRRWAGGTAKNLVESGMMIDETSIEGAADMAYAIGDLRVEFIAHDARVPIGFWRSVGHSENAFIVESFLDELAHAAGKDPYLFRRNLLARSPRDLAVLDLAASHARWGSPTAPGVGRGVACHASFGSYCAQVAEVSVERGRVRVRRVVCAIDCGTVVNPDLVAAQMESGIVFGLSAALKQAITFRGGRVEQTNFHEYPMLRMHEMPEVEVHIVPSTEAPTGAGEPGVPPIAPAVANAIFAASGQRIRTLPIEPALRAVAKG